jgi:uncharacterized membrane protein YphA (DoxX/SURF4 family)
VAISTDLDEPSTRYHVLPSGKSLRRLHAAAGVRIGFGVVWAIDAAFKWLPGFINGQTPDEQLGKASSIRVPVIHQWIQLWHATATAAPGVFGVGTAVVETLFALGLVLGAFTNLVCVASAVFSFGIWSAAEGFHLPWTKPGITDLGPSVAYIFASLALMFAYAGATWSLDTRLRPALGRLSWLSSLSPTQIATANTVSTGPSPALRRH